MTTQNRANMFLWPLHTNVVAHIPPQKVYIHHTHVMMIPPWLRKKDYWPLEAETTMHPSTSQGNHFF